MRSSCKKERRDNSPETKLKEKKKEKKKTNSDFGLIFVEDERGVCASHFGRHSSFFLMNQVDKRDLGIEEERKERKEKREKKKRIKKE